jgi:hypothetical protein
LLLSFIEPFDQVQGAVEPNARRSKAPGAARKQLKGRDLVSRGRRFAQQIMPRIKAYARRRRSLLPSDQKPPAGCGVFSTEHRTAAGERRRSK